MPLYIFTTPPPQQPHTSVGLPPNPLITHKPAYGGTWTHTPSAVDFESTTSTIPSRRWKLQYWTGLDSNLQPFAYQTNALPLSYRLVDSGRTRTDISTVAIYCSTNWTTESTPPHNFRAAGLEPTISRAQNKCINHYATPLIPTGVEPVSYGLEDQCSTS